MKVAASWSLINGCNSFKVENAVITVLGVMNILGKAYLGPLKITTKKLYITSSLLLAYARPSNFPFCLISLWCTLSPLILVQFPPVTEGMMRSGETFLSHQPSPRTAICNQIVSMSTQSARAPLSAALSSMRSLLPYWRLMSLNNT